jgi:D-alanine-D-alanine ligase
MRPVIKRVTLVYDLPSPASSHPNAQSLMCDADRPTERDVCKAIKKLGYELAIIGVFDDVQDVCQRILATKPDVVFNLCETFQGRRDREGHIAALLELTGIPYTGANPAALHLCKDKALTKLIAGHYGVGAPQFMVIKRHDPLLTFQWHTFPAIVKPLDREGSEGISQASLVQNHEALQERIHYLHTKLNADVIVEEFIEGREIYVGMAQLSEGLCVFPPRELFMRALTTGGPMIATFKAKWDDTYRHRWGIQTSSCKKLSPTCSEQLTLFCKTLYAAFNLSGYARIDWRLSPCGELKLLEVNPNPALSQDDDFAKSAKQFGLPYEQLISELLQSAISNHSSQALLNPSTVSDNRRQAFL